MDRESWKAVLVSLAKFPIGLVSLIVIAVYLNMDISLILSPLIYRSVKLQIYGTVLNTPIELGGAVLAGLAIFILGAQVTEKTSLVYLKLNSII